MNQHASHHDENPLWLRVSLGVLILSAVLSTGCRTLSDLGIAGNSQNTAVAEDFQEQPFQALDNIDPRIRKKGAAALGQISPIKNRYMEIYIGFLDVEKKEKTLKTIGDIGDIVENLGPVVDALVNACRDYDSSVRQEALSSLQLISGQLILVVDPLNNLIENLEGQADNENVSLVRAAEKTLTASNGQNQRIIDVMTRAQNDPVRSIRNFSNKYMLMAKNRPRPQLAAKPKAVGTAGKDEPGTDQAETVKASPEVAVVKAPETEKTDGQVKEIDPLAKAGDVVTTETVDEKKHLEASGGIVTDKALEDAGHVETAKDAAVSEPVVETRAVDGGKSAESLKETKTVKESGAVAATDGPKPSPAIPGDVLPVPPTAVPVAGTASGISEQESDRLKTAEGLLKQLESFELANRRFALVAMGPYIQKELESVEEKIASVKKGDITLRTEAADVIVERVRHMENIVSAMCHATEDVDREIRLKAVKNLADILLPLCGALVPFEDAPKEIEDALTKEKVEVEQLVRIQIDQFKKTTQEGIVKITGLIEKIVPVFFRSFEDKDLDIRNAAGEGLKGILLNSGEKLPLKPVWEGVFKKLNQTPVDLRIRLLMNDLENPGVNAARTAARALGEMGPVAKNAVPSLIQVIQNKSNLHVHYKYVQMEAMAAIGSMGQDGSSAVYALMDQLGDIRFEIRSAAVLALGKIGGKKGVVEIVGMLENDKSSIVRESAADALSNMDPTECLDKAYMLLFKALKDSNAAIRMNAFSALSAYELKNRAAGIIRWKPSGADIRGYRVCSGKGGHETLECIDTGLTTVFRLGDFKTVPREGKGAEVKAVQGDKLEPVEFAFVDVMSLLEKSAASETNQGLKEKKNKALLEVMKNLLNSGINSDGGALEDGR